MFFINLFLFNFLISCHSHQTTELETQKVIKTPFERIDSFGKQAFNFCKSKKMNTKFCILIDMSIHSGKKRFYVYNFQDDTITNSCLVGHGCGDNPWSKDFSKENPKFSNLENSHCSSLGKYKLGTRGYSEWGIHVKYLMHGLEPTNNNALKRFIVFHSWDAVSENEIYPAGTPEGWGCPTISNASLQQLDPLIKSSKEPILMWIYN